VKRSRPQDQFTLEALEPRIMLAADPLVGAAVLAAPDEMGPIDSDVGPPPLEASLLHFSETLPDKSSESQIPQYDPTEHLADIFSGLDDEPVEETAPLSHSDGDENDDAGDVEGTNHRFSEDEGFALQEGMAALAELGAVIERYDIFDDPIFMTGGVTLGQLIGPGDILDTRLAKPVYDYFSDATDPPVVDGLIDYLDQSSQATDDGFTIDISSDGFNTASGAIRFTVELEAIQTGFVRISTDDLTGGLVLFDEVDEDAAYTSGFIFNFDFGIDYDFDSEGFFLEVNDLTADLVITADSLQGDPDGLLSEGEFQVVDGDVTIDIHAAVAFDNAGSGDGRMSLADLRSITPCTAGDFFTVSAAGTLAALLVLNDTSDENDRLLPTVLIDVDSDNIFSDDAPDLNIQYDISSIKNELLTLFDSFGSTLETFVAPNALKTSIPIVAIGIDELISAATNDGGRQLIDLHSPALAYFELIELFNTNLSDIQSAIGALPEIDIPEFDFANETHRLKLKSHLEQTFNISISADWDIAFYLPEIWSLLDPVVEDSDGLSSLSVLMGLPYLPKVKRNRFEVSPSNSNISDEKSDLNGDQDHLEATSYAIDTRDTVPDDPANHDHATQSDAPFIKVSVDEIEEPVSQSATVTEFGQGLSEGRADFDTRSETITHGLDPPHSHAVSADTNLQPPGNEHMRLIVESSANPTSNTPLSGTELSSILDAAVQMWANQPLSADQLSRLNDITVLITDLPSRVLGETQGITIYIDDTASGHGWFVDETPEENSEFHQNDATHFDAEDGSDAEGHIDLLTVLLHEIGHVLGHNHDSDIPVMDESLDPGHRVTLDYHAAPNRPPVDDFLITGTAPNLTLDLSGSNNNGNTITISVNSDGTVDIAGSADASDNGVNIADITNIIGNPNATITLEGPDLENDWTLTGVDTGTLSNSAITITFSNVQNLTGGSGSDGFTFEDDGGVSGDIIDGTGDVALSVGGFVVVTGNFDFSNDTVSGTDSQGTTLTNAQALTLSLSNVDVFVGVGATLTGASIDTTDAIGFEVTVTTLDLAVVVQGATVYAGLEVTGLGGSLTGLQDFEFEVDNVDVWVNLVRGTSQKLDWGSFNSDSGVVGSATFSDNLDHNKDLQASGDVALDALGFVVAKGTFNLTKQTLSIDDGSAIGPFNADVLTLTTTLTGFAGVGASLSQDPVTNVSTVTVETADAIGFNLTNATIELAIVQDTTTPTNKYLGLEVGLSNASLDGISDLTFVAGGQVQVNDGPVAGNLNWNEVTGTGNELPNVDLAIASSVKLAASGSVAVDAFGFVVLSGTFTLSKQRLNINDGIIAAFDADVLSLSLTVSGFAGVGGSLSSTRRRRRRRC
jgi:hypothetical protein